MKRSDEKINAKIEDMIRQVTSLDTDVAAIIKDNRRLRDSVERQKAINVELAEDNDRMNRALKLIMEIEVREFETEYGRTFTYKGDAAGAVREAQKIMKGGAS